MGLPVLYSTLTQAPIIPRPDIKTVGDLGLSSRVDSCRGESDSLSTFGSNPLSK